MKFADMADALEQVSKGSQSKITFQQSCALDDLLQWLYKMAIREGELPPFLPIRCETEKERRSETE